MTIIIAVGGGKPPLHGRSNKDKKGKGCEDAEKNAIKYYREIMKTHFDTEVGLREAKDFVDHMQDDMISRGVIVK